MFFRLGYAIINIFTWPRPARIVACALLHFDIVNDDAEQASYEIYVPLFLDIDAPKI